MSATNPKALASRWFEEVWNQRRTETVRELFPEDGIGHMEGLEIRGPEPFLQVHAEFLQAFPDLRMAVEDILEEGDAAVVRWHARGTHGGSAFGLQASGKPVAFRGMTWMRFEDGVLVEGWDSWNQAGLMQHLSAP